jgi:hypothetical protein
VDFIKAHEYHLTTNASSRTFHEFLLAERDIGARRALQ